MFVLILVFVSNTYNGMTSEQLQFYSKKACETAANQVLSNNPPHLKISAICIDNTNY